MNELLHKRTADMTVIQVMEAVSLIALSKKITIDLDEFCEVVGKDKSMVYRMLKNKLYPAELLVGGYENRKQKTKLLFHTDRVIEWLKK